MINTAITIELGSKYISKRCIRLIGLETISKSLQLHAYGDWGDCSENDILDNYQAIEAMGVVRSIFKKNGVLEYYIETNLKTLSTIVLHVRDI